MSKKKQPRFEKIIAVVEVPAGFFCENENDMCNYVTPDCKCILTGEELISEEKTGFNLLLKTKECTLGRVSKVSKKKYTKPSMKAK